MEGSSASLSVFREAQPVRSSDHVDGWHTHSTAVTALSFMQAIQNC